MASYLQLRAEEAPYQEKPVFAAVMLNWGLKDLCIRKKKESFEKKKKRMKLW